MIEDLISSRAQLQHATILGLALYAWARGDAPEKRIGAILLTMAFLEYPYHIFFGQGSTYENINVGHLIIDMLILALLVPVAMRANRLYPLWILAAQLISVAMHFNREIAPGLTPLAYWLLSRLPSYIQLLAFAIGLISHARRVRQGRLCRPWRKS